MNLLIPSLSKANQRPWTRSTRPTIRTQLLIIPQQLSSLKTHHPSTNSCRKRTAQKSILMKTSRTPDYRLAPDTGAQKLAVWVCPITSYARRLVRARRVSHSTRKTRAPVDQRQREWIFTRGKCRDELFRRIASGAAQSRGISLRRG